MKFNVALLFFALNFPLSLQGHCGNSVISSGLIVGGSGVKRGQWPFIAALFSTATDEYFCSGTVISYRHVITAAHCIQPKWDKQKEAADFTVHLGRYNISKNLENGSVISHVDEIHIHPDWVKDSVNYDADLAILQLEESIHKSYFIDIVCWPTWDSVGEGFIVRYFHYFRRHKSKEKL